MAAGHRRGRRAASLLDQIDDAIASIGNDEMPAMARAARVTYLPPREPNIRITITGATYAKTDSYAKTR
jgi:hypothetical protein